jgi:hypothetical protein
MDFKAGKYCWYLRIYEKHIPVHFKEIERNLEAWKITTHARHSFQYSAYAWMRLALPFLKPFSW